MTAPRKDRELAAVQLAAVDDEAKADAVKGAAGAEDGGKKYDYVELRDKKFRVREKVGAMAMFKWSAASELDTDDPRAYAAIYAMIKSVILKEDWPGFEAHALDTDADGEELLDVVGKALEAVAGRPTKQS